jgi:spore maturation protein CgeB
MKLVIFGLTVSSSWGNGHATLWRGLIRALAARRHRVVFFERDAPWYAAHRDLAGSPDLELILYGGWNGVRARARRELADADVGIVTSFCPDAIEAAALLNEAPRARRVFYDLDTPVTLERLEAGERVPWIDGNGLADYDLVLSYTGGSALTALTERLGARHVAPLYGSVDPEVHRPAPPVPEWAADLSYLGTYAEDRQPALDTLFLAPARRRPERRFVIGGSKYPDGFPWTPNLYYLRHVPPGDHAAFYCSSRFTLNVTRQAFADRGHCPSGRLFEAAACGAAIVSDGWEGLDRFFTPGREIVVARDSADVEAALDMSEAQRRAIAVAARNRALDEHTAARRALELERALERPAESRAAVKE